MVDVARSVLIGTSWPQVPSGRTVQYSALLVDQDGAPITPDVLDTLLLTLIDTATGDIVNGVDEIDVLNTGRGSVSDVGVVTITLGSVANTEDTEIIRDVDQSEIRSLILGYTYTSTGLGLLSGSHRVDFLIVAL